MNKTTDENGDWEEYPQSSGAVVRILIKPSPAFEAKRNQWKNSTGVINDDA